MNKNKSFSQKNNKQRFADVPMLQQRIKTQTPPSGQYFYDYKLQEAKKQQSLLNTHDFHQKFKINFSDLPICSQTQKGLNSKKFIKMTQVQRCVISHALSGRDVMAASRTGSGKTLAYLIPLVQKLYRNKFLPMDGLGAIILVPVRQLAMQVFEVLNSFTSHMQLSVGLIIGGKDLKYEQERIRLMNILVCTPGRLLQHLEETYGFQTNNLQFLVLDEADVMLQMGFKNTLNQILQNLPKCQTMFFSATLNNDIHKLADVSMTTPERVFLHTVNNNKNEQNNSKRSINNIYQTPAKLMQYYMITKSEDKFNVLYSFLKAHQKQKILIFTSTCKQVRFIYQSFKKFRLGCPMYELQGHQKQKKRMAIYFTFCQKKYGILVCTNIASRGLDFPMVDWVLQLDIPEDVQTYVHRVGRTARFKYQGKALAFVTPNEEQFVANIKEKGINIHKITQNPQRYFKIDSSLQSICSEHQDIKYLAQRALISYIQFVYKAHNKKIFNLKNLNLEQISKSYGLLNAPNIQIKIDEDEQKPKLSKIQKLRLKSKQKKEINKQKTPLIKQQSSQKQESQQQQQQQIQSENIQENELFKVKNKVKMNQNQKPILTASKRQLKKIKADGHYQGKNKIFFDQNLNKVTVQQQRINKYMENNLKNVGKNFQQQMVQKLQKNRNIDQKLQKQRRKQKRKKANSAKQLQKKGISKMYQAELQSGSQEEQEAQQ